MSAAPGPAIVACGALAREIRALSSAWTGPAPLRLRCLPAIFHNRPGRIPERLRAELTAAREAGHDPIFVAYADCGTGGEIDRVCAEFGVERLPGAHCYAFFAGEERIADLLEEEIGTFFVTDFLARHFDRLIWQGLGLEAHPELRDAYFGNYRRLAYLAQTDRPELEAAARRAAERLDLEYVAVKTGYGALGTAMAGLEPRSVPGPVPAGEG